MFVAEKHEPVKTGKMEHNATVDTAWKIIDELKLDRKMCDVRYWFESHEVRMNGGQVFNGSYKTGGARHAGLKSGYHNGARQ
jgi:hypothetical protein